MWGYRTWSEGAASEDEAHGVVAVREQAAQRSASHRRARASAETGERVEDEQEWFQKVGAAEVALFREAAYVSPRQSPSRWRDPGRGPNHTPS